MHRSRSWVAAGAAATLLTMTAPLPLLAADQTVTLRLATPDDKGMGRPSEVGVRAFADAVARESAGTLTVEVLFNAGGDESHHEEQDVAERVLAGDVDMAVVPVRAWGDVGVTELDALMAPLLIDNDALQRAVATDPLVLPMLDRLADHGLVGLAVWPEGLRHIFAHPGGAGPILSPGDLRGRRITVLTSRMATEVMSTLGATTVDELDQLAATAAETGLSAVGGPNIATGDLTIYPKYQVVVIEDSVWSRLTSDQRAALGSAAASVARDLGATRPTDVELGAAYCAAGGVIVRAGSDNIAAFRAAVSPVLDRLRLDPATSAVLDAISALKARTPSSPTAAACDGSRRAVSVPRAGPGPATTLVPDSVWQRTPTRDELLGRGALPGTPEIYGGNKQTLRFQGDSGAIELDYSGGHEVLPIEYRLDEDRVRMRLHDARTDYWLDFRWVIEGDRLILTFINEQNGTQDQLDDANAIYGGPWTRVE